VRSERGRHCSRACDVGDGNVAALLTPSISNRKCHLAPVKAILTRSGTSQRPETGNSRPAACSRGVTHTSASGHRRRRRTMALVSACAGATCSGTVLRPLGTTTLPQQCRMAMGKATGTRISTPTAAAASAAGPPHRRHHRATAAGSSRSRSLIARASSSSDDEEKKDIGAGGEALLATS